MSILNASVFWHSIKNPVRGSCHVPKAVNLNILIIFLSRILCCYIPSSPSPLRIKINITSSHLVYSYGSCVAIKHNACHTHKVWVFGTIPDGFLLFQVSVVKQYRNLSQGVSCSSAQIYL